MTTPVMLVLLGAAGSSAFGLSALSRTPTAPPRRAAAKCGLLDDIVKGAADAFSSPDSITAKDGLLGGALGYSRDDRTARASHILFSFEAYPENGGEDGVTGEVMAEALKQKIEAEEFTFEFVAEKFSGCTSAAQGGDLGTFKRGDMVPEFDKAVFDLSVAGPLGTIQGPVKTQFGHHLIKVVERSEV